MTYPDVVFRRIDEANAVVSRGNSGLKVLTVRPLPPWPPEISIYPALAATPPARMSLVPCVPV
jgi:hypothetical protein